MTSISFLIAVFLSATTWTTGQGSTGYTDKYPHEGSGYSFINVDDGCSDDLAVGSNFSIPIGTSKYHHLYVTTNGRIPLESCTINLVPSYNTLVDCIAPYWADLNPFESVGIFSYRLFFNSSDSIDWYILQRAGRDVQHFDRVSFTATLVLVATWDNIVLYYDQSQSVTVQCVLISDGVSTYTIFNYLDVDVTATPGRNVSMGWYDDTGNHLLNQSFTTQAFRMSQIDGNQGEPGFWFFKLTPDNCQSSPCKNGATCEDIYGDFICHCLSGFTLKDCGVDINECETDICQNGGSCHNTVGSYYCECTNHWNGTDCTDDINECDSSPCMNDMPCVNTNGSFYCECSRNYGGNFCEVDINECETDICQNGGSCHNTFGSYYCECTQYWNGTNCTDDINECETDICQNGGSCHNTVGSFYCECTNHWNGTDCTDDINECDSSPCMNDMPCVNTNGSFYCECSRNYGGNFCEVDINECETDICQNGGSCHNTFGSYYCECTQYWNGTNCTDDINECESSPCMNDMQCVNTNGSFLCNCSKNYGGRFCENGLRSQFYCNTSDSSVMYCKYGCCGHGRCKHCCKNEIAIGYITASVVAVAMVITGGVVTFVIKRRLTKTNREREFRTIETQTEIKIHPATEWKTTSDPLRGKLYAVNGHITPPPSGVIDRIVEMRKSRARTSKERKDKDDPESRISVTKPVHDTIERPISRFDSLSSIKTNDEVVELDVF